MSLTKDDLSALRQVVREELAVQADPFYDVDFDEVHRLVKEGVDSLEKEGPLPGPETMAALRARLENRSGE